jgi:serine/threonine protein phosphatase PrpC
LTVAPRRSLKPLGVSATPDVTSFDVKAEQRFVLLGCDGLWKVFDGQRAIDFVHERLPKMDARRAELAAQAREPRRPVQPTVIGTPCH